MKSLAVSRSSGFKGSVVTVSMSKIPYLTFKKTEFNKYETGLKASVAVFHRYEWRWQFKSSRSTNIRPSVSPSSSPLVGSTFDSPDSCRVSSSDVSHALKRPAETHSGVCVSRHMNFCCSTYLPTYLPFGF